jgi:hypothetical protein
MLNDLMRETRTAIQAGTWASFRDSVLRESNV